MFEDLYKETFQQIAASPDTVQEVLNLKNKQTKRVRLSTLAAAVLLICVLATTAFAYTGFVVYENPGQMLDALFGNKNQESYEGRTYVDEYGQYVVEPSFQKEAVNQDTAESYLVPYIFEVGKSITYDGNPLNKENATITTLTVEALAYDPHTQCGVVYLHMENPDGIAGYTLQPNAELCWDGPQRIRSKEANISLFLDEAQSTDTSLAIAGYFYHGDWAKNDELVLYMGDRNGESEELKIPLDNVAGMNHITLGNGGIQLSPIGVVIHGDKLDLLDGSETKVRSVSIRYTDGSVYLVSGSDGDVPIHNFAHAYMEPGDGYETDRHCVTILLNRIVPVGEVSEVIVNGVSYPVD